MRLPPLLLLVCIIAHSPALCVDAGAEQPVAFWQFEESSLAESGAAMAPRIHGEVKLDAPGPRLPYYAGFPPANRAARFSGKAGSLRIGSTESLKFRLGDTITIEAWVQCSGIKEGQQTYLIGKGRTQNPGAVAHNQNWALRLRGKDGAASLSFLFRDARNRPEAGDEDWHRWTSEAGIQPGDEWHHVAVSYTFGNSDSIRGYLDGKPVAGGWDMGGATDLGPVVDDDEVWIGSSMGGSPNSTLHGALDDLAIHRSALAPERIAARYTRTATPLPIAANPLPKMPAPKASEGDPVPPPFFNLADLPQNLVRVEILEHSNVAESRGDETAGGNDSDPPKNRDGVEASWSTLPGLKTDEFTEPAFALTEITEKYNAQGVKTDRSRPFLVRAAAVVTLPPGEHKILLRALAGSRLALDGQQIAGTEQLKRKSGDAEPVPDQAAKQLVRELPLLPPGHREALATIQGDGQAHVLTLEAFVGGKSLRPELGELSLSVSSNGGPWRLLGAGERSLAIEWPSFKVAQRERIARLNAERRRQPAEEIYWKQRHALARQHARPAPAVPSSAMPHLPQFNAIDAFINARLAAGATTPSALTDDSAFLRRVTLDTIGLLPTPEEVATFIADQAPNKRAQAIDRLLADVRWADRWVPYWQDVLAENPNLLKGTLNNTGPFRYWLHEALLDNRPADRFVTELVGMQGSAQFGGPAGFGLATQNDLPMAAKAQIVSSAFLAMEMKCARCHDAPNHPFDQAQLFNLAAMLQRQPLKVPASSLTQGLSADSHVVVSLKAGQVIDPHWPFADLDAEPLPGVLRNPSDSRERLAAALTDPRRDRFAQVMVNRLWQQFLGFGIVDPVDDWEDAVPANRDLLRWLAHQLITHDYDLKHVARLILNSAAYQREPTAAASRVVKSSARLFEAPARRRMTAEQLVDSVFALAGKEFGSEPLTQDPENRQAANDHGNFGVPRRAWEFASLSNERDRPALAKPRAQVVTDVLATFGWRDSRPEPRTTRDHDANVLQPALLANGTLGARIIRLSDDSAFTALALEATSINAMIETLFLRILSRPPTSDDASRFRVLLELGFADRKTGAPPAPPRPPVSKAVSWASHLNPEATTVILAVEQEVKAGDVPTPRLVADWRERMEDAVWALLMTPEFIHLP